MKQKRIPMILLQKALGRTSRARIWMAQLRRMRKEKLNLKLKPNLRLKPMMSYD
jgi:hypothetical protein